jgi:hypothetical protein
MIGCHLRIKIWSMVKAVNHIEFTRAPFYHHIVPGQAVKQY